jgi:hypothetical protein
MSRLVRVLVAGSVLVVLSLGSTAHAQDAEAPPPPAGPTQQDPTQDPTPAPSPDPTPDPTPDPSPAPAPDPAPTPAPTTTTTTQPQVDQPKSLQVTVSPRSAKWGTTVKLTADLRGCTRPNSAEGFFYDRRGWGVDGAAKPLISERVTGGRWYSAQYQLTKWDAVGQGRFGVVCDFNLPTEKSGYASFQVHKLSVSPVVVRVTPQAGGPGTVVRLSAETPECQDVQVAFYDRKGVRTYRAAKGLTWQRVTPRRVTGQYTVTSKDAVGQGRFVVICFLYHNPPFDGYPGSASFQVRAAGTSISPASGSDTDGNGGPPQTPSRIDTGLGGTADGAGRGGLDPAWLLPSAGLLLIVLAAGLRLRQATARRRQ